jgi:hypothetical protein
MVRQPSSSACCLRCQTRLRASDTMQESIFTLCISAGPSVIRTIIELSIRYLDATFLLLYYFPYSTGSWSAWYRRLGLAVSKAAGRSPS